jgi:hypothetical protein
MGSIVKLLNQGKVGIPQFNNYMSVELTENVHWHYRGIRLEFTPEEFLFIRKFFCSLTEEEVELIKKRKYGYDEKVVYLRITNELPKNSWWKNQFQIEKCRDGSVHFHLDNLRIGLSWEDYKRIFEKGD